MADNRILQSHIGARPRSQWIISKKKYSNSIGRHFSQWKRRFFELDGERAILIVRTRPSSTPVRVDLKQAVITYHHYSAHEAPAVHQLSVKQNTLEFVLQFDSRQAVIDWETDLKQVSVSQNIHTQAANKQAFIALSDFIQYRSRLQLLVIVATCNSTVICQLSFSFAHLFL